MNSCLYEGHVAHGRSGSVPHSFRHRMYLWHVDLDELDELDRRLTLFGHNRAAVTSIHSRDHLGDPRLPIRDNVLAFLRLRGVHLARPRLTLLTNARVLGHVFNPLSVFYCHDGEVLTCAVAEVHNTFGERHCYLLRPDPAGECAHGKEFYVSPFLAVDGTYRMTLVPPGERLHVRVELAQEGGTALVASLTGRRVALDGRSLASVLVRHPLMPQRVSLLIRRHGVRLHLRGAPRVARPPHAPQAGVG